MAKKDVEIHVHRSHSEAYYTFTEEAKQNILKKNFRMMAHSLRYEIPEKTVIHIGIEEWNSGVLPKSDEHVRVILHCMLTEAERLMISREYIIV